MANGFMEKLRELDTPANRAMFSSATSSVLNSFQHYMNGRAAMQSAVITGRSEAFGYRHKATQQLASLRSVKLEGDARIMEEDLRSAQAYGSLANSYAGNGVTMSGSASRNLANVKLQQQIRRRSIQNASTEAVHDIRMGAMMSAYMAKVAEIQASLAASMAKAGTVGAAYRAVGTGVINAYSAYKDNK